MKRGRENGSGLLSPALSSSRREGEDVAGHPSISRGRKRRYWRTGASRTGNHAKAPSVQAPTSREIPSSKDQLSSCHVRWLTDGSTATSSRFSGRFQRSFQSIPKVLREDSKRFQTPSHSDSNRFETIPRISNGFQPFFKKNLTTDGHRSTQMGQRAGQRPALRGQGVHARRCISRSVSLR